MSGEKVIIAVDALGADDAPSVVLDGVKQALNKDLNLHILLCGPKDVVEPFCSSLDRCYPINCTEAIEMHEHPAMSVRKKKDSTIVVGCKLVKEKKAKGFFSAGNTGACLTAATLIIGRIKGVLRPMLATNVPNPYNNKETMLCDLGANSDCKPNYLLQFAIMAKAYKNVICNIAKPKIGLLNIGEEETKGSLFAQETHNLIKNNLSEFSGNAEGKDILSGKFDAIVTDGFTGNIVLKSMEGTFRASFSIIKNTLMTNLKTKICALFIKKALKNKIKGFNPDTIGSALLFGVKGACCVGHCSSSSKAICSGIINTANVARSNITSIIENEIEKLIN